MSRRGLALALGLVLGVALLAASSVVEAQPAGKVWKIGFLGATSASGYAPQLTALREGLRDHGYEEGRNIVMDYRFAEGNYDRLPALAAELARQPVDLIVTHGAPGSLAAKQATSTIPIVMAVVHDPVEIGLVASLARPGGNVTGTTIFNSEITAKRLELLKEAVPRIRQAGVLVNPDNPSLPSVLNALELTAKSLKVGLQRIPVRGLDEIEQAFSTMVTNRTDALVVLDDALFLTHARQVAEQSLNRRLPGVGFREYAAAGGLMAYGVSYPAIWRRTGVFVDKILKGAAPATLPVERAAQFELLVNMKTAKGLGVSIAQSILTRADQILD